MFVDQNWNIKMQQVKLLYEVEISKRNARFGIMHTLVVN
jgi:hypothetical protein